MASQNLDGKVNLDEKVKDLMTRHAAVLQKKAVLSGQLQAKRDELADLINEIKAAGYDPKTLVEEGARAKASLEAEITTFEADLVKAEAALAVFEKK